MMMMMDDDDDHDEGGVLPLRHDYYHSIFSSQQFYPHKLALIH